VTETSDELFDGANGWQTMSGRISFTPGAEDSSAACRTNFLAAWRRPAALKRFAIVIGVFAVLGASFGWFNEQDMIAALIVAWGAALYAVVLLLLIMGITFLLLPRRTRKLFAQQRSIQRRFDYGWSDEGLEASSDLGSVRRGWREFHGWRRGPSAFLIYHNDQLFEFLPLRAMTGEEAEDLHATLTRVGPPLF
jgi:hypothetical protein